MTEQDVRKVRKFRLCQFQQMVAVRHGAEPAAGEVAIGVPFAYGLAVTHVVVGHHDEAPLCQHLSECVVALRHLRNAVDDLEHRLWLSLRHPAADVNPPCTAGIKPEVLSHDLLHHLVACVGPSVSSHSTTS